ncbi:hypothetical protein CERZMDRAFT_91340 [Cercospora zeae-maydis SCOH1-5]|uniref:4a-hydroxytetrahydrobiopterin dehydratase n=1 Tax=Cercospora zeae-maydis SCOH1-5 TaxID=717836 RepID=A0A6A6F4Y6_9PEZI|nr:hypothetical protein CERZMDRAFT_91340 [Cercospora zeae-maydis SCOH1-5]
MLCLTPASSRLPSTALVRLFSSTRVHMVRTQDLSPSAGEDPEALAAKVTELVDRGRWQLCNEGKGLERGFKFKTFKSTWSFMNTVAEECKKQKHHPEWSNVYNKTHIRWTTHSPEGISSKDTSMADFCDQAAKEYNELDMPADECKLAADGKVAAGDCCTPSKKL